MDSDQEIKSKVQTLPNEILFNILDFSVELPTALSFPQHPTHPAMKTALALSKTCKAVHKPALYLLYSRCCFVNGSRRLKLLLRTLEGNVDRLNTLPLPPLACLSAIHLNIEFCKERGDHNCIKQLCALLSHCAPYLERLLLVWELPKNILVDDRGNPMELLHKTLTNLKALKVYCSLNKDHFLTYDTEDSHKPLFSSPLSLPAWRGWHSIQVLTLQNTTVDYELFEHIVVDTPQLRTLVLSRPCWGTCDPKLAWSQADGSQRPRDIVVVDTWAGHRAIPRASPWTLEDPVRVIVVTVPTSYYGDEDSDDRLVPQWIFQRFLQGQYQQWDGETIIGEPHC